MKSYTYLLIDFFTILIPFIFSFHPRLRFDKQWPYFFQAMVFVALFFLVWDEIFTQIGVWGFNPDYLIGFQLFSLPLEEILFFICIPYACVFTYHCFGQLNFNLIPEKNGKWISLILLISLILAVSVNYDHYYTAVTGSLLALTVIYLQWIKKRQLARFYFSYLILLIPFFITNGILTGSWIDEPIVWYNNQENMHFRLGTIPVEDIFYGMLLIWWNIELMEIFQRKAQSKSSSSG